MRSSLLSAISHDLRSPLAAITGAGTALRDDPGRLGTEQRAELVDTICTEAERMERLIGNVLDMVRIESGGMAPRRDWVPLEEVLGSALLRLDAKLQGREVRTDLPEGLPLVPVDPVLFEQVFVNLLDNAVKYTPSGSPVEISARASDHGLEIEVADRGPGIAPGDEERIFEKFHRGAHAGGGGVGLGLPICRGIVRGPRRNDRRGQSGGRRDRVPDPPAADGDSADGGGRDAGRGSGMSEPGPVVLVVEDEPQLRRFLRTALTAQDFRIVEAETVREALIAATTHNPELILLDIGLPDGDGIDLTRRIREWSRVPIIVISARGQEDDKVAALDAGADDYLTKPFGVNELLARIRVALRHALSAASTTGEPVLEIGPLRLDLTRREVRVAGAEVHLTPLEYRLLALLAQNAGKVLTHRQILKEVWGPGSVNETHYLRVFMAQLRRKIEPDPARPRLLLTEPGVGYRMRES